ncbi:MAG: aminopeptidase [Elusimicrobiota bacterium]
MKDKRNEMLARLLVDYSTELKKGDVLYLEMKGAQTLELGKQIMRLATEKGATPFWYYNDDSLLRQHLRSASDAQLKTLARLHLGLMRQADAYIGIRGNDNPFDLSDMPPERMKSFERLFFMPVHLEQRIKRTRWVVLRYPNNAMAQLARMSQESFEDFYFDVCLADYAKMSKALDKVAALMRRTDKVSIKAPGTDLSFSIKGIPCVKCDGRRNIPDGEIYTAPVRGSVNGAIRFNTPTLRDGVAYGDITLSFRRGKIVKAEAGAQTERLNRVLDVDDGARHVGEFSLGVNPFILKPVMNSLFDEKIAGSFHFTPGACYDEAYNGNRSALHWDMVQIQRPEHGGGEIRFDGKLVRKDGVFTDPAIERMLTRKALSPKAR